MQNFAMTYFGGEEIQQGRPIRMDVFSLHVFLDWDARRFQQVPTAVHIYRFMPKEVTHD